MKHKNIQARQVSIGQGTVIEESASIRGVQGKAERIVIGDHCYIGANVQIMCDDFALGDYGKIHHDSNVHGSQPCHIGHNAWIGQFCIIDTLGGVRIGDNCGIGAHSQLWSHIKYGDTLEGNRFNQVKTLQVGKDVWFVGHCIVSPITAADRSMAMVGSVVTRDMAANTIYAGVPAQPISDKIGPQFAPVSNAEKLQKMQRYLAEFAPPADTIRIVTDLSEARDDGCSYFAVASREYTKRGTAEEVGFMKFLLPEKAKFTPAKM